MDLSSLKLILVLQLIFRYQLKSSTTMHRTDNCCHGELRLVNGTAPHEGRVEICLHGLWKTICDDFWSYDEASVACSQLGYPREDSVAIGNATFGQGSGSIVDVFCCGSEGRLIDCHHGVFPHGNCSHAKDAGAKCLSCQINGDVRLIESACYSLGHRVEVCVNNTWNTVCGVQWNSDDARVVCKQLGYSKFGSVAHKYSSCIWPTHLPMSSVQCTGSELHLMECYHAKTSTQTCYAQAYIHCEPALRCQHGMLRIADGRTVNEGRVEICFNETWGTICNNYWDQLDANVVCRSLGYSEYGAGFEHQFGPGNGPIHLSSVSCSGYEASLINCSYNKSTIVNCNHQHDVGVQCSFDTIPAPLEFRVSLDESNNATMSWQPPITAKKHGNVTEYFVNCSTEGFDEQTFNTPSTEDFLLLQPYALYQCCVFAINQIGLGDPACKTVFTHEEAPSAPPTFTEAYLLNGTTIFLSWRPPVTEYRNGVIQGYYIQLAEVNSTMKHEYTTKDQYLFVNNLKPDMMYTCRIAAHTVGIGPFSDIVNITQISGVEKVQPSPLILGLVLASGFFLLICILLMLVLMYVTLRLKSECRKEDTRCAIQSPVNEMVDIIADSNTKSTTTEQCSPTSTSRINFQGAMVSSQQCTNPELSTHVTNEDHTYQALIPAQYDQMTISAEYQSLTHFAVAQLPDSPPPLPPKPKEVGIHRKLNSEYKNNNQ